MCKTDVHQKRLIIIVNSGVPKLRNMPGFLISRYSRIGFARKAEILRGSASLEGAGSAFGAEGGLDGVSQ